MTQQFGRYQLKRQLGQGGMATVHEAYDPTFDRSVAIKILPESFLNDDIYQQRFKREAVVSASLQHPAIIDIFDFVADAKPPYLVMRYMAGGSLADKLKKEQLSLTEVDRLLTRLAPALDLAHEKGIYHRDLKPGNILFDEYDNAHLADFGIAKRTEATISLTGSAIVGTPVYMSPEQAQGLPIDGRSDIYALGIIIYQLLTGQIPHQADTPVQMLIKRLTEPAPNILDYRHDLPPRLEPIITKALNRDVNERFNTATDFATAFHQIVATLPTPKATATKILKDDPLPTPPARYPTPPPTPPPSTPPAMPEPIVPPPPPANSKKKRAIWPWLLLLLLIGLGGGGFVFRDSLFPPASNTRAANTPTSETAVVAIPPTPTNTNTPSATPTPTPSATPTNTATPTPSSTATPTQTPTPTNTATPTPSTTPTPTPDLSSLNPVGFTGSGNGTPLDFETFGTWGRSDTPNGAFVQSDEVVFAGEFAGKLLYTFTSSEDESVAFLQTNAIEGRPAQLQAWVFGDESGHYLNLWIVDAQGQLWQVPLGEVTHTGWQQMTGFLRTSAGLEAIDGPNNGRIDYPISLRALVLDDASDEYRGQGVLYIDDLTAGTESVATLPTATTATTNNNNNGNNNNNDSAATPSPSATPTPNTSTIGRIIYTSGSTLLSTDPTWRSPVEIGTAVSDSCASPATTVAGDTVNLYFGNYCGIGGTGAGVCTSPNGQWEVITGAIDESITSIVVRPTGADSQEFIFQGRVDRSEGIRWSPSSDSFLFVERDAVHRAFPTGGYNQLVDTAFNPIISQDGSLILYRRPVGPGVNDIFIAGMDGSPPVNVTNIATIDKSCAAWRN